MTRHTMVDLSLTCYDSPRAMTHLLYCGSQQAIDNHVDVIDTTQLLHVSHLTADDGDFAGW